jgi:tetratricopeptide (TPR) repeat protein
MKEVSRDDKVPLYSPDAEWVFSQFEINLTALTRLCKTRHIPLIVSDVTSNLMFPPFASDSMRGPNSPGKNLADVERWFYAKKYPEVLETLTALRSNDSTNALVNYWTGRTYLAMGNSDSARIFLARARDNDLLKFRAPERSNMIIRRVCAREGIPLISSDSLFSAVSVNGIPGRELFWEHLHPTARGYYEIAGLFLQKILDLHLVAGSSRNGESIHPLPFVMDSLSICWLDLAFADISMRNLTKHWPFENYESRTFVIEAADSTLQNIAYDLYASKIPWSEGCLRSAMYFQQHSRFRDAATTYEALLEEYPTNFYSHYLLGFVYKEMGEFVNAATHYSSSIKYNSQYPYPRIDLGLLEINEGRIDEAIENFTTALHLTQGKGYRNEIATIYYGLSAACANKGDFINAKKYIDSSLSLSPSYQPGQLLQNKLLHYK